MPYIRYFGKDHRLRVIKPFYANFDKVLIPEGTGGKVIEGQDLYGYVFVEFYVGRRRTILKLLSFPANSNRKLSIYSNSVSESDIVAFFSTVTLLIWSIIKGSVSSFFFAC